MIRQIIAPAAALFLLVFSAHAQDSSRPRRLPLESDPGLWTTVEVKAFDLRVTMPAKASDVVDESSDAVESLHALTTSGTYSVVIKSLDKQLDTRNTESLVDDVVTTVLSANTRLLEKHDVEYEGSRGKQVTYIEGENRLFARIFYLNGRLIVMSATFRNADYNPQFDLWVDKFFDSFRVSVPLLIA